MLTRTTMTTTTHAENERAFRDVLLTIDDVLSHSDVPRVVLAIMRDASRDAEICMEERDYIACMECVCTMYNHRDCTTNDDTNERIFELTLDACDIVHRVARRSIARRFRTRYSRDARMIAENARDIVRYVEYDNRDDTRDCGETTQCVVAMIRRTFVGTHNAFRDSVRHDDAERDAQRRAQQNAIDDIDDAMRRHM